MIMGRVHHCGVVMFPVIMVALSKGCILLMHSERHRSVSGVILITNKDH